MDATSLYRSFRGCLKLSANLVWRQGPGVNVGEKFGMRFTVTNTGPDPNPIPNPAIFFKDTAIFVEGTEYAEPVGGSRWFDLPGTLLKPGESSSVQVEFTAKKNIPGSSAAELVASVQVLGHVDTDSYFGVWNELKVHQQIEPAEASSRGNKRLREKEYK